MKKILYFFPKMSLKNNAGNVTRVISLLKYFKSRDISVDFYGLKNWNIKWSDDLPDLMLETKLVDRVFWGEIKPPKENPIKRFITFKIPEFFKRKYYKSSKTFKPYSSFYLVKQFDEILEENEYDFIVINYVLWVNLIKYSKHLKNAHTIVDTQDFLSVHASKNNRLMKRKKAGDYFQEEIDGLSCFDEVWAVSVDEYYIFSQFLNNNVKLVPNIPLATLNTSKKIDYSDRKYDIIYVASENPWNQMSSKWFLSDVYPLLPKNLSICIIGKINEYIKEEYSNIEKIHFVEDLGEMYANSRISICPMLEGTGIKLKIIEAMSFGLPIVTNIRGIDGLPNKINNGCLVSKDAKEFADNIIKTLTDRDLYNKLSKQGYDIYEAYFNPEIRYKQLDDIFNERNHE